MSKEKRIGIVEQHRLLGPQIAAAFREYFSFGSDISVEVISEPNTLTPEDWAGFSVLVMNEFLTISPREISSQQIVRYTSRRESDGDVIAINGLNDLPKIALAAYKKIPR